VVFLESIFVRKEDRHKGIGKILLDKAQNLAEEYGNETLYMSVHPNNEEMLRFLRDNGYDVLNLIEIRKAYHDENNDDSYTIGNNTYRY
ncbi:MAG: GNAT family N-acetyltransferase, partial [Erysipelotrichaceae bacterium]|nr:GNAT family N-acetyltransferase [Erysipelotrichaceae bacterium]